MAGSNDFIPFATGGGANVESQASYVLDPQVPIGQQPGIAKSALNNKALRQGTSIAAALAQYLANVTGNNVLDDGVQANLLASMGLAFGIVPSFAQAFTSGALFAANGTGAYIDPGSITGTAALTVRRFSGIILTQAAGNLPGFTFTPESATATYEITANFNLENNAVGNINGCRLYDGSTTIGQSPDTKTSAIDSPVPTSIPNCIYTPGVITPVTVKLQLSANANTVSVGDSLLQGNAIEWTIKRITI